MQLVRHLLESLSRFSPDAVVSPEVDVKSINPAVSCNIFECDYGINDRIAELEKERDNLEGQLSEIDEITMKKELTDSEKLKKIVKLL